MCFKYSTLLRIRILLALRSDKRISNLRKRESLTFHIVPEEQGEQ